MATSITVNGNTYNDGPYNESTNPNGLANGGWRVNSKFIMMLLDTLADATATMRTTSTTSLTISTGSVGPLTLAQDIPFAAGDFVMITDIAAPTTNWMQGQITNRTSNDITVDVTHTAGSGTLSSWTVQISAPPGESGAAGQGQVVDTAANQALINPTVVNTVYFESDTGRAKIGDGSSAYTALAYIDSMEGVNSFAISTSHGPTAGTITVDCVDLDEVKLIAPTGDDTIDFTNISTSKTTLFLMRLTNGGAHTLTWTVNGGAATVTLNGGFTFTAAGTDECVVAIDEKATGSKNMEIYRIRTDIA